MVSPLNKMEVFKCACNTIIPGMSQPHYELNQLNSTQPKPTNQPIYITNIKSHSRTQFWTKFHPPSILTTHFPKINLNVILPCPSRSTSWPFHKRLTNQPTNQPTSMDQRPSWEANSHSASQEMSRLSWNTNLHYCVQNRQPYVTLLSQINPV